MLTEPGAVDAAYARRGGTWTWGAIALVTWGVMALGAAKPWGYVPLMTGISVYGVAALLTWKPSANQNRALWLALGAVWAAIGLQLVPLPLDVVRVVSPFSSPGRTLDGLRPLSINPTATMRGLAYVGSLALFFAGTVRAVGHEGARRFAAGLVALGMVVALVGLTESMGWWSGVYGVAKLPLPPDSTPLGPFSSKNHYAGWMLMTLAVALGYLGGLLDRESTPTSTVLVMAGVSTMAVALVQTRSRAGILGLVITVVIMSGLVLLRRVSSNRRVAFAGTLLMLPLMGVVLTGAQPLLERFSAASWASAHGRLPIWRQAAQIARDFPLTGSGFNTYQTIVTAYPSPDLDEPYEGAHNDYLQLAVEGGLLVGLPAVIAAGLFIREVHRRWRDSRHDAATRWIRSGAVVGLATIAAQETVDFSLQVPGNAVLFTVLAAIAIHHEPVRHSSLPIGGLRSHVQ